MSGPRTRQARPTQWRRGRVQAVEHIRTLPEMAADSVLQTQRRRSHTSIGPWGEVSGEVADAMREAREDEI